MAHILTIPASATGVPSVEPAAGPPDDYQRIQTSPRQFGAQVGEAEEAFGANVLKVADFYDKAAAEQAYTEFQHGVNNMLYGDPDKPGDVGFMGLTGEDAMKARPMVQKQMEDLLQKTGGGLLTGRSQLEFQSNSRRLQSISFAEMGRHYEREANTWGASVAKGGMITNQRSVANTYNDDGAFQNALERQNGLSVKWAQHTGRDPTEAMAEGQSQLVQARIQGAIAQNDYTTAQHVFDAYGDKLDANTRATIAGGLRTHGIAAAGARIFQRAQGREDVSRETLGQSQRSGGWGPLAQPAIETFRAAGASDAFIQGALANGLGEGGFKDSWQQSWFSGGGQREESFGHWQFHKGGELEGYLASEGRDNPQDTRSQAQFLMRRMEEIRPGITRSDDPRAVTDAIATQFEKYQGAAPGQRYGLLADAQRQMAENVIPAVMPAPSMDSQRQDGETPLNQQQRMRPRDFIEPPGRPRPGMPPGAPTNAPDQGTTPNIRPAANMPPGIPAPGVAQVAAAQQQNSNDYARTLQNIMRDPEALANPQLMDAATKHAQVEYQRKEILLSGQMKAITEARNLAADGIVQKMMRGPIDPAVVQEIASNPALDMATRENLWGLYEKHTKNSVDGDAAKYGPKFFDAMTDPAIRDYSQLLEMAKPKADGSQDLTIQGVDKLHQIMQARASPEKAANNKIMEGGLTYAKRHITQELDTGFGAPIRSPGGMDKFETGFLPAFMKYWEDGIAGGKTPQELVAKDKLDALMQPFMPSEAEKQKFILDAGGKVAEAAVDLKTEAGIVAAYRSGKITRDAAAQALVVIGAYKPLSPPIPAAPTISVPVR